MNLGPFIVKEKITRDIQKGYVIFTNIEDSDFIGEVYNRAVINEKGEV
jgi:hypothetical protein